MVWNININQAHQYIEVSYSGRVTPRDLQEAFDAAITLSKETGITRFLADCMGMAGGHSIVDLFNLISQYESSGIPHKGKEAIVLPSAKAPIGDISFYETACLNRGYMVKVFTDIQEAMDWLKKY